MQLGIGCPAHVDSQCLVTVGAELLATRRTRPAWAAPALGQSIASLAPARVAPHRGFSLLEELAEALHRVGRVVLHRIRARRIQNGEQTRRPLPVINAGFRVRLGIDHQDHRNTLDVTDAIENVDGRVMMAFSTARNPMLSARPPSLKCRYERFAASSCSRQVFARSYSCGFVSRSFFGTSGLTSIPGSGGSPRVGAIHPGSCGAAFLAVVLQRQWRENNWEGR